MNAPSVRGLLETARLEAQAGPVAEAQLGRLILRPSSPVIMLFVLCFTKHHREQLKAARERGLTRRRTVTFE